MVWRLGEHQKLALLAQNEFGQAQLDHQHYLTINAIGGYDGRKVGPRGGVGLKKGVFGGTKRGFLSAAGEGRIFNHGLHGY